MKETIIYWILWVFAIVGMFVVLYDVLVTRNLTVSQQCFALTFLCLTPISYGYWSERQDVCS